jgi:uncharacterized repeat protein (TIGR01451 family)
VNKAVLTINKTADRDPAKYNVGETVVYTIDVVNTGPDAATGVVVTDTVPVGLTYVSSTLGGVYDPVSRMVTWNLANLAKDGHFTPTVTVTVDQNTQGQDITNTATAKNDQNPTPVTDTETIHVNNAVLTIKKTGPAKVTAGTTLSFTIVVKNTGPDTAYNVVLTDPVPILTGITWTLDGIAQGAWTGSTALGNMVLNQTHTIVLTGMVPASTPNGTQIVNTASVKSSTDPNPKESTATTIVETNADLTITKTDNPDPVVPGQLLTYTIIIKNNGPSDAQDVRLYDNLDSQLENAQYSLNGINWFKWPPAIGYLSLKTLAAGDSVMVYIRATVSKSATKDIPNTARVTSPTGPNDKEVTINTHLKTADVGVTKTVSNNTPEYLDTITYTITATNYGPDSATGVEITDILPASLRFLSSTPSQGGFNSQTGVWSVGTLLKNQSATLKLLVQVVGTGIIENTAEKTKENEYDPNPKNDKDSVKINVPQSAVIDIDKTASNKKPRINDTVFFTYVLHNNGPDTALKVYVVDVLPPGLTYVSSKADYGNYDPVIGIWNIGSLPVGKTATLVIESVVTRVGDITNKAKVYSITYDPVSPNPEAEVTITVEPKPEPPEPPQPHGKTVPMQPTGFPVVLLVIAMIAIIAGIGLNRKR